MDPGLGFSKVAEGLLLVDQVSHICEDYDQQMQRFEEGYPYERDESSSISASTGARVVSPKVGISAGKLPYDHSSCVEHRELKAAA